MKKFLVAIMFGLMAIAAQAEATFDQIQTLIEQREYAAAEKGLETIIQNHPKSAKAFYAMAQAQAGLGNQEKAKKALDIATGLNPTLDFAPASSVASLKQAITPQVAKIESIEESHFWRNAIMALVLFGLVGGIYLMWRTKKEQEDAEAARKAELDRIQEARMAREAAKVYASTPTTKKTVDTQPVYREPVSSRTVASTPSSSYSAPQPTVVNNHYGSSNDGLLTGVLIGNMMGSHDHHHDTVVRERVIEREVPAKSSTWDDTPAPSKSSSWDDAPSKPSRSSSWDDSSSSSSKSSSWDSSSSSSSSSWDSGSSSSDSGSSSSWD